MFSKSSKFPSILIHSLVFSNMATKDYCGCIRRGTWLSIYGLNSHAIVDVASRVAMRSISIVRWGIESS